MKKTGMKRGGECIWHCPPPLVAKQKRNGGSCLSLAYNPFACVPRKPARVGYPSHSRGDVFIVTEKLSFWVNSLDRETLLY